MSRMLALHQLLDPVRRSGARRVWRPDPEISEVTSKAMDMVVMESVIQIEESNTFIELETVEEMRFAKLSPRPAAF